MFNHESPRRGETFVTRKVTRAVAKILAGKQDSLYLGNLDAKRDWGFAGDYVEAMWLMLQQEEPDDYVIATGATYSVREFLNEAFQYIGVSNYEDYFVVDPEFYRPAEVEYLKGRPTKAEENLDWHREVSFKQLVHRMVESDINAEEKRSRDIQKVRFVP